ncbi:methyltransferase [Lithospermum erythrorhizon]|uniref:Methyltransferase n=1 Tax=Lithospermum erythrorhizon TaxID=34254 RepID=A0AAV3PL40_LITER
MAGENSPYYTPTSKPTSLINNSNPRKKTNLYSLVVIIFLCSVSYLLGVWQRGGGTTTSSTTSNIVATINCLPSKNTTTTSFSAIDFKTHHSFDTNGQESINISEEQFRTYPPCDIKYSEYTPCEHQERSLKFNRDRLIYRERHCPKKNELLKCLIPAPHGYRNPFKWPMSRDVVWYNNVPHKELTVEKAVQNWIRFEGDQFRFPGGGTMFPNGADAYIDDIGKFINLKDGSIRTAIDTGCGVASWGAYLMSRNIVAMSFAPRDTHEAQVQFALERGVPALIGVLASKRLPYPSRSFDMAHCSRCLIPWGQYDGEYLIEVDRVLRPGGYWILSGPPIHWRRHWRGWERTREDLNSEQTQIETITNGLCWKKIIEKDDIAIWQKPINHANCKKFKRVYKTPPFCPSHDHPDKAWFVLNPLTIYLILR